MTCSSSVWSSRTSQHKTFCYGFSSPPMSMLQCWFMKKYVKRPLLYETRPTTWACTPETTRTVARRLVNRLAEQLKQLRGLQPGCPQRIQIIANTASSSDSSARTLLNSSLANCGSKHFELPRYCAEFDSSRFKVENGARGVEQAS